VAIEGGKGKVSLGDNISHSFDNSNFLILPGSQPWTVTAQSPILKILVIEIRDPMIQKGAKEFQLDSAVVGGMLKNLWDLPRSNWHNEIFHRYCFERSIAKQIDSLACVFLEAEIIKEIYFAIAQKQTKGSIAPYYKDLPEALMRALTYMEQNLHSPISADDLASASVVSKPTLVRLFRSHLGTSPVKYLWDRRLDEADRLLLTGRYTVAEVAGFLCFSDSSSLSKSYRERFGVRPSTRISNP
jgi:AraC-like DNA-binding protein